MTGDDRAPAADRGLGNRPPAGWEEMTVTLDVWDGRSRADGLRLQAARAGITFRHFDPLPRPEAHLFNPTALADALRFLASERGRAGGIQGDSHDR